MIRNKMSSVGIVLLFAVMLVCPRQVFLGAQEGLLLWFHTVLPSLLPFSIISSLLIKTNNVHYISNALGPFLRPFFQVTDRGVFVIVVGFLCGYPLGAKVINMLFQDNQISKYEANYLLSFCNNVSPIFIINFLVYASLQKAELTLPVLIILLSSPIICSFLFRVFRKPNHFTTTSSTPPLNDVISVNLSLFHHCMMDGFEMMVVLGGYIMAFSIFFTLLRNLIKLKCVAYILPLLEVTNGITYIQTLPLSFSQKLLFTLPITSFGGFCAIFQTKHVLQGSGISIGIYTIKKLITMLVTSLLTFCYLLFINELF